MHIAMGYRQRLGLDALVTPEQDIDVQRAWRPAIALAATERLLDGFDFLSQRLRFVLRLRIDDDIQERQVPIGRRVGW